MKKKTLFTSIVALLLAATMFLGGCAAVTTPAAPATDAVPEATQQEQLSYVSIDINPSIELTLSEGLVIEAKAYNEDGTAIVLAASVVGMTSQEAVKSIVNEFASQGYIVPGDSSPAIVITVAGNTEEGLAEDLKQNAEQSLSGLGLNAEVLATDVAEEIVQTAENCGLSVGKYLILKQIAINENITIEEAKEKYGSMKMSELLAMVGDKEGFIEDVEELSSFLNNLTPEQLQILTNARLAFQTAMKNAQQAFLAARTQAKEAYMAARDAAKDAFLATKDNEALKLAKKQIKDAFADAKKAAIDAMKQAKIEARNSFYAAAAALGLDAETLEKLADWDISINFDFEMDFNFENGDQDNDKQGEDKNNDKGKGNQGKGNNGKGNSKNNSSDDEQGDDDDDDDGDQDGDAQD